MTLMTPYGEYVAPSTGGGEYVPPNKIDVSTSKFIRTSDRNSYQSCIGSGAKTLTFDATTNINFNDGDRLEVSRNGSGGVTLTATGSVNLYAFGKGANVKTHTMLSENTSVFIIKVANNDFRLTGLIV